MNGEAATGDFHTAPPSLRCLRGAQEHVQEPGLSEAEGDIPGEGDIERERSSRGGFLKELHRLCAGELACEAFLEAFREASAEPLSDAQRESWSELRGEPTRGEPLQELPDACEPSGMPPHEAEWVIAGGEA